MRRDVGAAGRHPYPHMHGMRAAGIGPYIMERLPRLWQSMARLGPVEAAATRAALALLLLLLRGLSHEMLQLATLIV